MVGVLSFWARRAQQTIREKELAEGESLTPHQGAKPQPAPLFEYRSKASLLGWPLIHIRLRGGIERGPVKAWIAGGDSAIGLLFAFGGLAVAPISFGGFAAGLLTFAGCGIGLLSFSGFSLGIWALGGFAIGWQAFGGCAVGWTAAQGGVAIAHAQGRQSPPDQWL